MSNWALSITGVLDRPAAFDAFACSFATCDASNVTPTVTGPCALTAFFICAIADFDTDRSAGMLNFADDFLRSARICAAHPRLSSGKSSIRNDAPRSARSKPRFSAGVNLSKSGSTVAVTPPTLNSLIRASTVPPPC